MLLAEPFSDKVLVLNFERVQLQGDPPHVNTACGLYLTLRQVGGDKRFDRD